MKLKNFVNLIVLTILLGVQACTPSSDSKLEYFPVQVDKNDKWGMVNSSGELLFSDEFDNEPSLGINGVFFVQEDKGYSLYKATSKPNLIPGAENLKCAGYYTEGLIPVVREGERITLIDMNGKKKVTLNPINGKEVTACDPRFRDGNLRIAVQGGKAGSLGKNGKVIIEPKYDRISCFSEGICVVGITDENTNEIRSLIGYNQNGKELFTIKGAFEFTGISNTFGYQGGRLPIKKGEVLGYLDKKGEFNKLPSKYSDYRPFSNKYYGVKNSDGKWGIVNENNDVILRMKYDDIDYIGDNLFFVKNNERSQIITSEGDTKAELDEPNAISIYFLNQLGLRSSFYIGGGKDHSLMFFGKDGKPIDKGDYYNLGFPETDQTIESDFFDIDGIANYIGNAISQTGFERIKLNSAMSDLVPNSKPEDYSNSYHLSFNMDKFEFRNATAELNVIPYGGPIVLSEPMYSYENYYGYTYQNFDGYRYSWNPTSKVGDIELSISSTRPLYKKCSQLLVDKLKAKGFIVERMSDDGNWYLLKAGNTYVEIRPSRGTDAIDEESLNYMAVDIMSDEYYNNRLDP